MAEKLNNRKSELFASNNPSNVMVPAGEINNAKTLQALGTDAFLTQTAAASKQGISGTTILNGSENFQFDALMNGHNYGISADIAYLKQSGIPEWVADEEYYVGSIVREAGTSHIFQSVFGTQEAPNVGNPLTDVTKWVVFTPKDIDGLKYNTISTANEIILSNSSISSIANSPTNPVRRLIREGQEFNFIPTLSNTGAAVVSIYDGATAILTNVPIRFRNIDGSDSELQANDIKANQKICITYVNVSGSLYFIVNQGVRPCDIARYTATYDAKYSEKQFKCYLGLTAGPANVRTQILWLTEDGSTWGFHTNNSNITKINGTSNASVATSSGIAFGNAVSRITIVRIRVTHNVTRDAATSNRDWNYAAYIRTCFEVYNSAGIPLGQGLDITHTEMLNSTYILMRLIVLSPGDYIKIWGWQQAVIDTVEGRLGFQHQGMFIEVERYEY